MTIDISIEDNIVSFFGFGIFATENDTQDWIEKIMKEKPDIGVIKKIKI